MLCCVQPKITFEKYEKGLGRKKARATVSGTADSAPCNTRKKNDMRRIRGERKLTGTRVREQGFANSSEAQERFVVQDTDTPVAHPKLMLTGNKIVTPHG